MEEQPPIIEAPAELTVPPGDTAFLFCNVTSKIKFDLEWKRRGASTVNSPRISQKPDGTLIIELRTKFVQTLSTSQFFSI